MRKALRVRRDGEAVPVARTGLRRIETCAVGEELGRHGHQGALGLPGSAEPRPPQQNHALDPERRLDGAQEVPRAVAEDEPVGVGAAEVDLSGEGRRVRGEYGQGVARATGAEPAECDAVRRRLRTKAGRSAAALVGGDGVVWMGELAGEQGGQPGDLLVWRGLSEDMHKWVRVPAVRGSVGTTAATPLSEDVQWLGVHGMRWEEHIAIDPAVRGGQPVIRGTRVPVDVILGALAAGERTEDLCHAYGLCEEQVRACLAFAAAEIAEGRYHAVPH